MQEEKTQSTDSTAGVAAVEPDTTTQMANGSAEPAAPAQPDAPAATAEAQLAQAQADLAQEQARYAELYDRYQRAAAEFQNSRRRLEKQMAEAVDRASTHVIRKLLPVLDDSELAFRNLPADLSDEQAAWVDGFRAIQKKLMGVLEEEGVTKMAETGPFDPARHEAVTSEPSDTVESGHIIATLRPGYESDGTVIRPALVRVAQ